MRSIAGVGMTPPNGLDTPYPASSVMISRTFGAPLGGCTRGGHHALESRAVSLITPPNFGSGAGSCFPSMVVVALGEPNSPVTCWANAGKAAATIARASGPHMRKRVFRLIDLSPLYARVPHMSLTFA